jgi:uncharacterized repeat protein (TIGR01451 family)
MEYSMGFFSFWFRLRKAVKPNAAKLSPKPKARLSLEPLESRFLPTCYTVSGYVFNDVNNDGLYNTGEPPIANAQLQLVNASNQVVNTGTTDNTGYYSFQKDLTIALTPQSTTQTLNFPSTDTDFSIQQALNQFNPSLGELQSVVITENGSITSTIKAENTSPSPSTINATVAGTMTLSGPGISGPLTLLQNAGTFNASAYDGTLDFGGTSGITFAPQSANGSAQITLTGSQLTAFEGTGTVALTESANATSSATGSGNLIVSIASTGQASVTVTYTYIPGNCLKPGNYTVVLMQTPAGYDPGKESSNGVVLNMPPGTNAIPVTLTNTDLPNNDFGELLPSSLSGYVYVDNNANGVKDAGDNGLPGVQITLSGTDWTGAAVSQTASTDPTGFYSFGSLEPGNYTLTEAQPSAYIIGKDNPGSQGGTAGSGVISGINLGQNVQGVNNNFGQLVPKADLAIVKAADKTKVQIGDPLNYTLTVRNLGPNTAQNVTVTDNLPSGAIFVSASSPGWTISQNGGVITATIDSLAVGTVDVIDVAIDAPSVPGNLTNTVTVTATTLDSNPSNNTSTVTTPVYSMPGKVFPKSIPPLVTTPAILSKWQLVPGVNQNAVDQLAMIDGLFRTLEGRPATYSEQVFYHNQLQSGALSVNALVNQLWASPAHLSIEARSLYHEILHRAPTKAELSSTIASLRAGAADTDIMLTLLTSSEYQAKHPDQTSFINGFYADVLGEIPSSLTRLSLVEALGAETLQQETQTLLSTPDMISAIVTNGFDNILRRPPTNAEMQYWTNQLQGGVTQDAFLHQLLVSSKFQQLCVNRIQY